MKANRKFMDEEAVSPVIGVILMVAITVILAAVIAAFVFGMGSSLKKTYNIAATASQVDSSNIVITFNGGPDVDKLSSMAVYINGSLAGSLPITVGSSLTNSSGNANQQHVVVSATFADSTTQVILDTYV